jgi:hypothetical protein
VSARTEHAGDEPDLEQNHHHSSAELALDSAQPAGEEQFKTGYVCTHHPTKSTAVLCRVICECNGGRVTVMEEYDSRPYRVPRECPEMVRDENEIPREYYQLLPPLFPLTPGADPGEWRIISDDQ